MRALVAVALTCTAWAQTASHPEFMQWMSHMGRNYATMDEHHHRSSIYAANLGVIDAHNSKNSSFRMGTNRFTDLTPAEFSASMIRGVSNPPSRRLRGDVKAGYEGANSSQASRRLPTAPNAWDWTNANGRSYMSPIKDQGTCGSCWAFASTATIESINAINHGGAVVPLSEQQLVSCTLSGQSTFTNQGCGGGYAGTAFSYVVARGQCTAAAYPYTATNAACATSCTPAVRISDYTVIPYNSEAALQTAVLQQPVVVTLYASGDLFQYYSSGVATGDCSGGTDHNVVLYGYDVDPLSGLRYWKLKNQWGTGWGENGYMRIVRNSAVNGNSGLCNLYSRTLYPRQA